MDFDLILRFLFAESNYIPLYLICTEVVPKRPAWKDFLLYYGIFFLVSHGFRLLLPVYNSLSFIFSIIVSFLQIFLVFRLKGKRLLGVTAAYLAVVFFGAWLCMLVNGQLFGAEWVAQAADSLAYHPVPISVVNLVVMLAIWLIIRSVRRLILKRQDHPAAAWMPLARAVLAFLSTVAIAAILLGRVSAVPSEERFTQIMMVFLPVSVLLFSVFENLVQEIRNLQLTRWGETVEKEKQRNEELVRDLRVFRHNIINTLHGLRGVIASGNTGEQLAYYESLAKELARLNNENVLALQRLRSPALAALLMEKLKTARDESLPMFLYTKGNPSLRGAAEKQMCEIAGVLIDNAVEAARESEAGNVRVQAAQDENRFILSVMNTYPDDLDTEAFLDGHYASDKPGHAGLGLASVTDIVRNNPRMSFIRRVHGRYAECEILLILD